MENIFIGLIKSDHNVRFKKAMIEKLIASKSEPSANYTLRDLMNEIEILWSIGQDADSNAKKCCATASLCDSFGMHYDLNKSILAYFIKRDLNALNIQDLMTHLINLIKIFFMPNLNRESNYGMIRKNFLVLIKWLRLINETFLANLNNFEICSNFVNILSTLNANLLYNPDKASSMNFLYFVQNDSVFCREYLSFTKSFLVLNDKYNSNANDTSDLDQLKKYDKIIQFLEKTILDTNSLMIRHVIGKKITLYSPEDIAGQSEVSVTFMSWIYLFIFLIIFVCFLYFNQNELIDELRPKIKVELENLCEIAKTIESFVNKSFSLYESTVKELLNFLCNISENSSHDLRDEENTFDRIDKKLAQLFQIFDLTKMLPIIFKFFEVTNRAILIE